MSATTWSKFFWADWESDEKLKLCSPGAQALWMRMLCVCAKEGGYLVIAGSRLGPSDLAVLTGWPVADVEAWWAELKRWGVFSVEGRGKVYCRRMVKDTKKAETARENGKNGGNPNLRKGSENGASDNQKATDKQTDSPTNAPGIIHMPEARRPERLSEAKASSSGGARGSRLPDDWVLSEAGVAYAAKQGFSSGEIARMANRFRDFWHAKAGADARKANWDATWRNWVDREADRSAASPRPKRVGFV